MADDQPMWGNNQAIAPTPRAAIVMVDLGDNFTIKGHYLSMIANLIDVSSSVSQTIKNLHKGYDRFQSLLSQLEIHGAGVSTKDANKKFLRSLPSAWSQVSLIMRTKPGERRRYEQTSFIRHITPLLANHSSGPKFDHRDLEQLDEYDLEANGLKWASGHKLFDENEKFYKRLKCRTKGNQDSRRRDAWNSGNKDGEDLETQSINQPKVGLEAPIIEYESDSEDEHVSKPTKEQEQPSFASTNKKVKTPRETVKKGLGYGFTAKACFVCGSLSHLIRDCDFHEKRMAKQAELNNSMRKKSSQRKIRPIWNNLLKEVKGTTVLVKRYLTRRTKVSYSLTYECLVLSPEFKLPDENQVLLRIPRQNNMYSFNLENIVPSGGLTCLISKATIDESNNGIGGTKDNIDAGDSEKEDEFAQDYFVLPIWSSYSHSQEINRKGCSSRFKKSLNLVDLPYGKKAIGTKWFIEIKKDREEVMARKKAKDVLAFAILSNGFIVYQMDVKSVFLYGKIDEEVYVSQPPQISESSMESSLSFLIIGLTCPTERRCILNKSDKFQSLQKRSHLSAVRESFRYPKRANQNWPLRLLSLAIGKSKTIVATLLQRQKDVLPASKFAVASISLPNSLLPIRLHFIRDALMRRTLYKVLVIHTDDNVADLLTKAFDVSGEIHGSQSSSDKSLFREMRVDMTLPKCLRSLYFFVYTGKKTLKANWMQKESIIWILKMLKLKMGRQRGSECRERDRSKDSTNKEEKGTDRSRDSTDKEKEGTYKDKDSTISLDEGTDDRTEARSATLITSKQPLPTIVFGDDETIAQVLLNMSQAKAVSKEKEKGVELKDFTIEERAKFLHDIIAAQRRFLAEQRAIAIRNKPPTRTQLRNQMMTYLKHVGNKKHSDLKSKTFEEIQALYEKVKRFDKSFTAVGSTKDEKRIKEINEGVKYIDQKRLKEEDTIQVTIDSEIIGNKSFIASLNKVSSNQDGDYRVIHRANERSQHSTILMENTDGILKLKENDKGDFLIFPQRRFGRLVTDISKYMKAKPIRKTVAFVESSNDSKLMEKIEALTTKIDSQFKDIKGEMKEMRDGCNSYGGLDLSSECDDK
ncbi:ribonuclease H-like domain-containing protein [Tanacetum coccineum]